MNKITYSIIGGGWRAEFYLRIAALAPEYFSVSYICVRNKERAKEISKKFNVTVVDTIDKLKEIPCDFIVNCINKDDISKLSLSLAAEGYAVLAETPACTSAEQAKNLIRDFNPEYKIQIAEQFHLKPMYQAIKKIIENGVIGNVNYINISVAHEYHAMSLIRFFLDSDNGKLISQTEFNSPILHTNFRNGEVDNKTYHNSRHTIKIFDFGGKAAVYDFDAEQYFSPIRTDHLLIRGNRGEIENDTVRYFNQDNKFVESKIVHHKSGNLDGLYNGNITFENHILYTPPFGTARLTDEETAIATVLVKMNEYLKTGKEFYGLKNGIKDVLFFIG